MLFGSTIISARVSNNKKPLVGALSGGALGAIIGGAAGGGKGAAIGGPVGLVVGGVVGAIAAKNNNSNSNGTWYCEKCHAYHHRVD